MVVSKIKPCMSNYKHFYCETANGSLNMLSFTQIPAYLDTCGNSRANTFKKIPTSGRPTMLGTGDKE